MKKTMKYAAFCLMAALAAGCAPLTDRADADVSIVIDRTDRMAAYPTATEILSPLGLKDDPYQQVRVVATFISDKDVNDVKVLTLEGESRWASNASLRMAKVRQFAGQLQQCLAEMKFAGTCPRSIIYRTIARQANRLAASAAARRYLVVYSDLRENEAGLSFYKTQTIRRLQKAPGGIAQQLEAMAPLGNLKGVATWLVYDPASFEQNNAYMIIANFYQHLLTAHGATAHVANKFLPL